MGDVCATIVGERVGEVGYDGRGGSAGGVASSARAKVACVLEISRGIVRVSSACFVGFWQVRVVVVVPRVVHGEVFVGGGESV